ncbi:YafY family protein [Phenylobacterium sp.]|uniref:helix-turn-helix transcriptional regulator n=1 Tax=Phenylobacterium sp. TaxID=1871053 RepID=UPI00272F79F3|nr:YafY family protein [Phenylobacterium sp.]MDP2215395.1 YafY family protein [Phenylobacterium sp.]
MRRADRLFQIIQILRRSRRPVTGAALAQELEVSLRTLYRDMADLIAQRVPIRGEAGVGYVLDDGFDMPPLMLTAEELEATLLGAQWVASRGDPDLARAAHDLVAKIAQVIPENLRPFISSSPLTASRRPDAACDALDMSQLRAALREERKVALDYRDEGGTVTARVIWPVTVGYFDTVRVICAWCELRADFRNFRTDRVVGARFMADRYPRPRSQLWAQWRKSFPREYDHTKGGISERPDVRR